MEGLTDESLVPDSYITSNKALNPNKDAFRLDGVGVDVNPDQEFRIALTDGAEPITFNKITLKGVNSASIFVQPTRDAQVVPLDENVNVPANGELPFSSSAVVVIIRDVTLKPEEKLTVGIEACFKYIGKKLCHYNLLLSSVHNQNSKKAMHYRIVPITCLLLTFMPHCQKSH